MSELKVAYDPKKLAAKLKERGLPELEDDAILVTECVLEFLSEAAIESDTKIDDIVAGVLTASKPYIMSQLDKIDGKVG